MSTITADFPLIASLFAEYPTLAHEDHIALAQARDNGDLTAIDTLVLHNVRLIGMVAKRYRSAGIDYEDLFQEGYFGLRRAAELYDWQRGLQFSTYAVMWIRQTVGRSVMETGRTIRVPVHAYELHRRVPKVRGELATVLHREPTDVELATALKVKPVDIKRYHLFSHAILSLDDLCYTNRDDLTLADTLADMSQSMPEPAIDIDPYLAVLTPREQLVVRWRFGVGNEGVTMTLEMVAQRLDLTRERVRQIELAALRKIRQHFAGVSEMVG